MVKLATNFGRYSFRVQILKTRRGASRTLPFPNLSEFKSFRSGNKLSRFFRHAFEKTNVRSLLGKNLVAAAIITSATTPALTAFAHTGSPEINTLGAEIQPLSTDVVVQYPVEKVHINQYYSMFHPGIDLEGITGDPVRPVMKGKVAAVEYSRFAYGNSVVLAHDNGFGSRYAHLSKIYVKKDDGVDTRTVIGAVGATGRATGDHLHFEVYHDGKTINPLSVLPR